MATANDNRTNFRRIEAAALNPFIGYGDQAETMRNIKHGLYFIAATAGGLETASGMALDGLQLCTECMIYALQQEDRIAESGEVTA